MFVCFRSARRLRLTKSPKSSIISCCRDPMTINSFRPCFSSNCLSYRSLFNWLMQTVPSDWSRLDMSSTSFAHKKKKAVTSSSALIPRNFDENCWGLFVVFFKPIVKWFTIGWIGAKGGCWISMDRLCPVVGAENVEKRVKNNEHMAVSCDKRPDLSYWMTDLSKCVVDHELQTQMT